MNKKNIKENYDFIKFDNDTLMYEYLGNKLKEGYQIKETIGLSLIINKGNSFELLSIMDVNDFNNIYNELSLPTVRVEYPDYDDTLLNVDAGIRNAYGYSFNYKPDTRVVDKKYKHIVTLILDGLGTHILNRLPDNSFLRRNYLKSIHAIYPSTTAAATTSIKSGLSPFETGWTGWANYLREINRHVVLFTGANYFTNEPTGVIPFKYIPYKPFFFDMKEKSSIIEPDFSKPDYSISYVLNKSLVGLRNGDVIQYVYHPNPDSLLHEHGLVKSVIDYIEQLDKEIEDYAEKLPEDTLLIVSADHGHINVSSLAFYSYDFLNDMLERKPTNDSRCLVFKVKKESYNEFETLFNQCFKNIYKLYRTEDAIKEGLFGRGNKHERIADFLGDFVALGINSFYFNYKGPDDIKFASHHAGITEFEMNIPLIRYVKR